MLSYSKKSKRRQRMSKELREPDPDEQKWDGEAEDPESKVASYVDMFQVEFDICCQFYFPPNHFR